MWLIASKPDSSFSRPFFSKRDPDATYTSQPRIGFTPALRACCVELDRAEEVAVVGHRDRRHAQRLGAREERLVLDRAVEQRELGVEMQVGEGSRHPRAYSHSIVAGGFDEMS